MRYKGIRKKTKKVKIIKRQYILTTKNKKAKENT